MIHYRYATPRPVSDDSPRRARTGAPRMVVLAGGSPPEVSGCRSGAPYRMAHPAPVRMAHEVRPLPANRSRIAPDLLALAVILAVVLAASLAGVRLP